MATTAEADLLEILLVEDSPSDALMTQEAFKTSNVLHHLHIVDDGVEAMAFLRREGKYGNAPRPSLILLDLNMPRKSGIEVLQEVKNDPALKTIPTVILTTSKAENDIVRSYSSHANCYVTKPGEFAKLAEAVRGIRDFWLCLVTLPPETK